MNTPITPKLIENWSEQAAFCHAINANPDDPFPHLVAFADWMSERGDERELGLRWLVRERKKPYRYQGRAAKNRWFKWWQELPSECHEYDIPLSIRWHGVQAEWYRPYPTLAAAYLSAATALVDQGVVR